MYLHLISCVINVLHCECECEVTQSCPTLCYTMDVDYQAPQSVEFSRHEYKSGLSFTSPWDLPDPGIEPGSPTLRADALLSEPPRKLYVSMEYLFVRKIE